MCAAILNLKIGAGLLLLLSALLTPAPAQSALVFVLGVGSALWNIVDRSWKFSAQVDTNAEGHRILNIGYGLADRRRQSIRIDRIHAVKITKPLLWRPFHWYRVQVNVAGYGSAVSGKSSGTTEILPVGTREQAMAILSLCSPLDRSDAQRYASPDGYSEPTYRSPSRARWISPVDVRQHGVTLTGDSVIVHSGRLSRRVSVVHNSHIQELTYRIGLLARWCRVTDVHLNLVGGPVRIKASALEPQDSLALLGYLRHQALSRARSAADAPGATTASHATAAPGAAATSHATAAPAASQVYTPPANPS